MSRLECRLRPRAQARKNMRQAHAARGISVPDLLADETTHCGTIDATFGHLCGHACAVRLSLSTSRARALLGTATLSRRIFRALKVRAASIRGQRRFAVASLSAQQNRLDGQHTHPRPNSAGGGTRAAGSAGRESHGWKGAWPGGWRDCSRETSTAAAGFSESWEGGRGSTPR